VQENTFSAYVTLTKVNQATSTGNFNKRKDPLYLVKATATNTIGSKTSDTGRFTLDCRELDLHFTDLTEKHLSMLTEGCEVAIFNAVIISYYTDIQYPVSLLSNVIDTEESLISPEDVVKALTEKFGEIYEKDFSNVIQKRRRQTVIKVMPMRWRITATAVQLKDSQNDSTIVESTEQIL
jgi:hypothetical protein